MTDDKGLTREELLKKIEECPSKRVKKAMLDSLNKENSSDANAKQ